jgi:hypothetical protein
MTLSISSHYAQCLVYSNVMQSVVVLHVVAPSIIIAILIANEMRAQNKHFLSMTVTVMMHMSLF